MKTTVQIILSCFIGLALWSCSSKTDAYAKLVSEWQGREIVFPDIKTDVSIQVGDCIVGRGIAYCYDLPIAVEQ